MISGLKIAIVCVAKMEKKIYNIKWRKNPQTLQ